MVLRSGIIIPFQFRDAKKLLMVGGPEENRELGIWDLKNVVRAAFGIYNFEFRNKKIGFNIPDDLLLHYLAQRHDLTNFVIEVGQANDELIAAAVAGAKEPPLSFEPSCSTYISTSSAAASAAQKQQNVTTPQRSNESSANDYALMKRMITPPEEAAATNHSSGHSSSNAESSPPPKIRISKIYSEQQTPETLTQRIDPMDISKAEDNEDIVSDKGGNLNPLALARYEARELAMHHHQQQHLHHQQQQHPPSNFFPNFVASQQTHASQHQQHHSHPLYSPAMMNRYRRRGERMSKDQKELYVKYFEENSCMLTQRRNDMILEPHWNKLASLLNSVQQGACKNVEEWKQTFDAWRYRVFMYTRYNSKLTGAAAQNPKNYKPLTPTDQRAYAMWTSHKNTVPQDFEKMDMFAHLDVTQSGDYDYFYDPKVDNYPRRPNTNFRYSAVQSTSSFVGKIEPNVEDANNIDRNLQKRGASTANSQFSDINDDDAEDYEEPPLKTQRIEDDEEDEDVENSDSDPEIAEIIDYDEDADEQAAEAEAEDAVSDYSPSQTAPISRRRTFVGREQKHKEHLERMKKGISVKKQNEDPLTHQQDTSLKTSPRQRKERMSKKQKEVYVKFIEQNPIINEHRRNDLLLDPYWRKLSDVLNLVPQGAVKNVLEWKQTFDNWRYRIFQYARYNSQVYKEGTSNSRSFKPLTSTDKRASAIWIRNPDTAPPDFEKIRNVFEDLDEKYSD